MESGSLNTINRWSDDIKNDVNPYTPSIIKEGLYRIDSFHPVTFIPHGKSKISGELSNNHNVTNTYRFSYLPFLKYEFSSIKICLSYII